MNNGWDGWGSPIGEIAETPTPRHGYDVANIGYPMGRIDQGEDRQHDIKAALADGNDLDDWLGWTTCPGRGRKGRSAPYEDRED